MTSAEKNSRPYFRRDQRDGISPLDLSKECTFAEHEVIAWATTKVQIYFTKV